MIPRPPISTRPDTLVPSPPLFRSGQITSYIHHNGKVGVLVEVNCETDFVARTDDFKTLAREIALHIASAAPLAVDKDGIPAEAVQREKRIFEEQLGRAHV